MKIYMLVDFKEQQSGKMMLLNSLLSILFLFQKVLAIL
jgi:hypothetical protein